MSRINEITPEELFAAFKKDPKDVGWEVAYEAFEKFKALDDKSSFYEPTLKFMDDEKYEEERADVIRSWGASVLGWMSGKQAVDAAQYLFQLLKNESTKDIKRLFFWTRFYALRSVWYLRANLDQNNDFLSLLLSMAFDDDEDYINQSMACILIIYHEASARDNKKKALGKIKNMLGPNASKDGKFKGFATKGNFEETYRPAYRALYALTDFPLPAVCKDVINVINQSPYYEQQTQAIQVLAGYGENEDALDELSLIIRRKKDPYLRQLAVVSLGRTTHKEATADLLKAIVDDNAEIRVQATKSLLSVLQNDLPTALRMIVQEAMKPGINDTDFTYLVEAIRRTDKDKQLSVDILAKEMESDDPNHAQQAQKMLYEIGGAEAFQKLNRRKTLEQSYQVLQASETGVQKAFDNTTLQVRRNFYFSMGINAVIVSVGIILIGLAVWQVIVKPSNFAGWITPGTGGVFGIILTLYFNGPRKNAQQDLQVLLNANIIYLGYLRMLNEIDATFKHDFIENPSFGANNMITTVSKINDSLNEVLGLTATHLIPGDNTSINPNQKSAQQPKPEQPQQPTTQTPALKQ
jgi:hypothetical protein